MSAPLVDLIARFRRDIGTIATEAMAIALAADGLLERLTVLEALSAQPVLEVLEQVESPPAAPERQQRPIIVVPASPKPFQVPPAPLAQPMAPEAMADVLSAALFAPRAKPPVKAAPPKPPKPAPPPKPISRKDALLRIDREIQRRAAERKPGFSMLGGTVKR